MAIAAQIFVETLNLHGVDRVFCVPGESYLAVIDAFYDAPGIDVVVARQEGGAGFMAVADAKISGRAGVVFVSRGPGATNVSIGVHVAQQDAVPLVLFIGQVGRADLGREAFQELDYRAMYGGMAKWVAEVEDASFEPVRRAGLMDGALWRYGYGIGIAFPPIWLGTLQISEGFDHRLEVGMTFTLHAWIGVNDEGIGMLMGGSYLLTDDGLEQLCGGGDVELDVVDV